MTRLEGNKAHALLRRGALLPSVALAFLALGGVARLLPRAQAYAATVWLAGLALAGAPVVWRTLRGAIAGRFAADLVATFAIVTAVVLHQPLVGLIVVLMQTGGEALERYAEGRASDAVRALEEAAPRTAHLLGADGGTTDVRAEDVATGDTLLVRPGELVPCDCVVVAGRSHVDTSRLTGEPIPVSADAGTRLMSGSANGVGALTVRALAPAVESQYARIVALVRSAQASKAPLQRVADRYAVWFTPVTLLTCAAAYLVSRDPLRVLAVLAVATPCPLILATPVAILGGINRAARRLVIVRHGTALERLGAVTVAVFDKTGTVTIGRPKVSRVLAASDTTERDVLRLAGAVERSSSHLLARTLVEAAEERGVQLPAAANVTEAPGRGVSGDVEGRRVLVGARAFVLLGHPDVEPAFAALDGRGTGGPALRAYVTVGGRAAGVVEYADEIRPGVHSVLSDLARLGVRRTVLLSGDSSANTKAVAAAVGIDEVAGDLLPEDKVRVVHGLVDAGELVLMVGDGTNDAPALSAATVGVALAGHGGGITAEAADAVVLADDLSRVTDAVRISRRTMRIARQSIRVGLGLSAAAMVGAAAGLIAPAMGALLQEAIDLAVIVNALRASRAPRGTSDVTRAAPRGSRVQAPRPRVAADHVDEQPAAEARLLTTTAAAPSRRHVALRLMATAAPGGHAASTREVTSMLSRFQDRRHAGQVLAAELAEYAGRKDVLVLGLARGGVPVASEVARALGVPLDVFVVRKLGLPGQEELAMGALASGGVRVLDARLIEAMHVSAATIERVTSEEHAELERREDSYRGLRPTPDVRGRTVILVDDGLATGASMFAAVAALKQGKPAAIVVAVPVGSRDVCATMARHADRCVCALAPKHFGGVGVWYADFSQTRDSEVRDLLEAAAERQGSGGVRSHAQMPVRAPLEPSSSSSP